MGKIRCLECGELVPSLPPHLQDMHLMQALTYEEKHGSWVGTCTECLKEVREIECFVDIDDNSIYHPRDLSPTDQYDSSIQCGPVILEERK